MCVRASLAYCVCACRLPRSHITSTSTPADLWGRRAAVGRAGSHDRPPANLDPPFSPLGLFCKAPLLLPLSGWKWTDGWGVTACDPQLNSQLWSCSSRITPACSCDMATLFCCSVNAVDLNMEPRHVGGWGEHLRKEKFRRRRLFLLPFWNVVFFFCCTHKYIVNPALSTNPFLDISRAYTSANSPLIVKQASSNINSVSRSMQTLAESFFTNTPLIHRLFRSAAKVNVV